MGDTHTKDVPLLWGKKIPFDMLADSFLQGSTQKNSVFGEPYVCVPWLYLSMYPKAWHHLICFPDWFKCLIIFVNLKYV